MYVYIYNLAGASASSDWRDAISGSICGWQRVTPWPIILQKGCVAVCKYI